MCGIAGLLLKPGCEVEQLPLLKMAEILRHRGPDHTQTARCKHFGCAHTRLSIVDLSPAGNQPFVNDRYILVYNGEIYNHLALREKLRVQPHEFRGTSDTATLFSSLVHLGVERTLELIRGMFAFAFYDCVEEILYLCRDRFGIKPLVWKSGANGLYWASEAKALEAVTALEPDPIKALHSLASIADHSAEYTAFKDVWQVPPGNYLVCKAGCEPVMREYYNLPSQVSQAEYKELDRASSRDVCERFLSLFQRSVKSMLMSDAPMGAFVSGGVDSSLVAAAVGNGLADFQLFTANVVGRFSEYADARLLADHIGRELHQSRFEPQQMIEDWARCTYHYEAPIITHTNSIPFASVARVARQRGVKAVLTGEGSDELFYGYPGLLMRRYKGIISLPVTALKGIYEFVPRLREIAFGKKESTNDFLGLLAQGFERQRYRCRAREAYDFLPTQQRDEHYLTIQMFREHLLSLLHRNDRMGMSASIEARFPFLDEELVKFALNLPTKWKIGRTRRFHDWKHPFLEDKSLVRCAAAQFLPIRLARKRKDGFPMFGHKYLKVRCGCFRNGYAASLLGMNAETEEYILSTQSRYLIAKLVSLEVFGRLFSFRQTSEEVTEHLKRWVTMETSG